MTIYAITTICSQWAVALIWQQVYNSTIMLTDEEIHTLTSLLATKQDITQIRSDMSDLKELIQGLIVASDNLATSMSNLTVEYAAISSQLTRHELWIKQIADKIGIKLVVD